MLSENQIGDIIIPAAITVHKALGPGLLENAYKQSLAYELNKRGLQVSIEYPLPLIYNEVDLETGYRVDLMIEKKVLIEIKAVEGLNNIHMAQIMTYLKLSECKLGYLLNFNVVLMKKGIKRVVMNY